MKIFCDIMIDVKKISFLIPVYNEERGILEFLEKNFFPVISNVKGFSKEVIVIDDGSSDKTLDILYRCADEHKNIKIIAFSKNFGKEAALSAGMQYAEGDAAIMIDADGQHPVKLIPEFIKKWEGGSDVVIGVREHYTKHGLVPRLGSKLFYKILKIMGNSTMMPGSTDYRLIDRVIIDEFNRFSEHNRITRGLIDWLGFKQDHVYYTPNARLAGKPSYDFKKLFNLAIGSFISMSTTPLVIFGYIGVVITVLSFLLGLFIVVQQHILGDPLGFRWNGAVQLSVFITFLVGLVLISQAITALYISHIYAESQGRPLFVVDNKRSRNLKKK